MRSPDESPQPETRLWAGSGAMALTGAADGPALLGTGAPASAVAAALARLAAHGVAGLPGVQLLGERAALAGTSRNAPWSVGGAFRMLPARDGWVGVSLARASDVELVPALVEAAVDEPWAALVAWLARTRAADAAARARLLGLPAAVLPPAPAPAARPGVLVTDGGPRPAPERPVVVDFSALWAGPLCAHLLGLAGAHVIKVESLHRPDGARYGTSAFFDLLHAGHASVALDFARDRAVLQHLVAGADVVIEASRPRALAGLGLDAAGEAARGAVWVSITAGGRADAMRVGFGDDVAAGAGLIAWHAGMPVPMGDALADPLTGVTAAAAALDALRSERGALLDVSMHDVCVAASTAARTGPADVVVAAPAARRAPCPAAPLGRDSAAVIARLESGAGLEP